MDQPHAAEQLPGLEVASTQPAPPVANPPNRPRVKAVDRSQMTWQMSARVRRILLCHKSHRPVARCSRRDGVSHISPVSSARYGCTQRA